MIRVIPVIFVEGKSDQLILNKALNIFTPNYVNNIVFLTKRERELTTKAIALTVIFWSRKWIHVSRRRNSYKHNENNRRNTNQMFAIYIMMKLNVIFTKVKLLSMLENLKNVILNHHLTYY